MHPYVLVSSSVFIFSSWVLSVNLSSLRTFVAQVNYLLVPRFWMQLYVSLSCSKIYKLVSRQLTLIDCFLITVSLSVHSINFSLILGCCLVLYLYCVWKCLSKYICAAKHKFDFFSCFLIDSKEEKEFGIYAFENQSGNTEFVHPQNIHHSRASKMAPYICQKTSSHKRINRKKGDIVVKIQSATATHICVWQWFSVWYH